MKKIYLFDTSLRDGAQTPGVNLTADDKIKIIKQLDLAKIDMIEAGFAVASQADFDAIKYAVENTKNAVIYSLARMVDIDIEKAYNALKNNIEKSGIHTFIGTSPLHRDFKLRMSKQEILQKIEHYMKLISEKFSGSENIMFSPEDALRTEKDFLFEVIGVAVKNGAKIINIPDTVGYAQPFEIYELMKELVETFPNTKFSIHCHNDLGNAVANTLSAIKAGTLIVQGTFPPLFGERAGNADLIQVALNLKKRQDYYNIDVSNINFENFYKTVELIENISGKKIPEHYPIVGRLVHSHSSGIHQHGVSKNKETYEIISPEEIGMYIEQSFILTNQSGREGLYQAIKQYFQLDLDKEQINEIFEKFKALTSKKKFITMDDIRNILIDKGYNLKRKINIVWGETIMDFNEDGVVTNIVFQNDEKEQKYIKSYGIGPVDSVFNAFKKYLENKNVKILDFQIQALGLSSQAKAKVYIKADIDGVVKEEYAIDDDIVKASINACLNLINRI